MQREPAGDQELNLKKRARRRLVGAVALVLMMMIILPMILKDRAAETPAEKVIITLPSDQPPVAASDFDSNIVPTDTIEPAATVIDETKPETLPEVLPIPKPEAPTDVVSEAVDSEAPSVAKEALPKNTPKNMPTDLLDKTPVKATEKTAEKTANKTSDKMLSGPKFYVQVGVFSDAANVAQLQAKLIDLGYQSKTEKMSTDKGQKIRLRTQTFKDRNEAAIALEKIKNAGLTGMVVSQ